MLPSRMFFDDMLSDFEKENKMKCDIFEKDNKVFIEIDRKSTRLNSSHKHRSRMPSSA